MCIVEILFFYDVFGSFAPETSYTGDSSSSTIPGEVFGKKFMNEDIEEINRVKK